MFKAKISGIEQAAGRIGQLQTAVSDAGGATRTANSKFLVSSAGAWATGASGESLLIENNLHVFDYALLNLKNGFDGAAADLRGEVAGLRDRVMMSVEGSASDQDKVSYDAGAAVDAGAASALSDLDALKTGIGNAVGSLAGLEDSGAIASQLDSLNAAVEKQTSAIEDLRSSYAAFAAGVASFEGKYSALFNPDTFIDDEMVEKANRQMDSMFAASGMGGSIAFLNRVKGSSPKSAGPLGAYCTLGIKGAKSWSSLIGKTLDGMRADKLVTGPTVGIWWGKVQESLGLFLPGQWRKAAKDFKAVSVSGKSAGTMSGLLKKAGAGNAADKFLQKADGVAKSGTKLKVFGRVLGWAGDAIEVANIVGNSVKAYGTAQGDASDRAAAAITTGTGQTLKFLATKGLTAIGAAFGGPVGAFVGTIAGEAVSWGIGELVKNDVFKDFKTGADRFISNAIDKITGGKESVFA